MQQFPADTFPQDRLERQRVAVEHVNAARAGRARFNDEEVEWLGRIKTEELWNTGEYTDWLDFFDKTWSIKKPTAWKYIYQDEFIRDGSAALWNRADAPRLYATGEDARELGSVQRPAAIAEAVRLRDQMLAERDVATMTVDELRPLLQDCFTRAIATVRFPAPTPIKSGRPSGAEVIAGHKKARRRERGARAVRSMNRMLASNPAPAKPVTEPEAPDQPEATTLDDCCPRADQRAIHELVRELLLRIGLKNNTTLYIYAPGERCGDDPEDQDYRWELLTEPDNDTIYVGSFHVNEVETPRKRRA